MSEDSDIRLLPYCTIDGIRTFKDSEILAIHDRIVSEGKEYIFKEGSISNRREFLKDMDHIGTALYVGYYQGAMAFILWLNRFEGRMARLHWCVFDGVSLKKIVLAGREAVRQLVNMKDSAGNYVFDLLIGYTPASNDRAVKFVKFCGGIVAAIVPNLIWNGEKKESEPGVISYYIREQPGVAQ